MGSEGTGRLEVPAVTAIVLAGGKSSRFGSDKASALLLGRPLLQWVVDAAAGAAGEVIVVAGANQDVPGVTCAVPARIVRDEYPNRGPLAGLVTAFEAAANDVCLALSCDAPLVEPALLRALAAGLDGAAFVPRIGGRVQPLVAAYRRSACAGPFRRAVEAGLLGLTLAVEAVAPKVMEEEEARGFDPMLASFRNVNRRDELHALSELLRKRRGGAEEGSSPKMA